MLYVQYAYVIYYKYYVLLVHTGTGIIPQGNSTGINIITQKLYTQQNNYFKQILNTK